MMIFIFSAALFFFSVSNYAYVKTSRATTEAPTPDLPGYTVYKLGGDLSAFSILAMLGWGLFHFPWWVPVAVLPAALLLAGIAYAAIPIGPAFVIVGYPAGVGLAVAAFVLGSNETL